MILSKVIRNFYLPSIKFPDRKLAAQSENTASLVMSSKMVKMTNRAALNAALD